MMKASVVRMSTSRMTAFVTGHVQDVGFRWWTRSRALELGLAGYAKNLRDGRVEVVAEGEQGDVDTLLALLEEQPSTAKRPGEVRARSCRSTASRGARPGSKNASAYRLSRSSTSAGNPMRRVTSEMYSRA